MSHVLPTPRRSPRIACSLLLALLALAALPQLAAAEQPPRILQNPKVITRPGTYMVGFNFAQVHEGTAIEVLSSDVTIDFDGHTVQGPGGLEGVGILIAGVDNVRVHGGGLAGFQIGVQVVDSTNVVIEDMQIDGEDLGGMPPAVEIGVLLLESRGVVVANNTITDTFLGVFVRGESSGGNRVEGNTITGGANGELGICYNPAPEQMTGGPDGDLVTGNLVSHFHRGIALSADSTANVVTGNSVAVTGDAIVEATPGSNLIADNAVAVLLE